ncbi:hypothetical protein [Streptomyces aurantiogriseus]|uniref:Uncharacterized protein n=1 Tax=Streptomyces aurantiogriseus TaxID=66870 RepID=A0A918C741_9ACTN|nr:hypothetical protein [Streptomyces aurantiogriseus]GGR08540.1 hypothetical protein GCM10010251_25200 [Streptomyces aurantiogriseus]
MPMNENVITLRFTDRAAAYQALSGLRHLNAASTEVLGAVLIERLEDGAVRVTEGVDGVAGRNAAADACIAHAPADGTVILSEVRETGTDTLDMLALWYGAALKRLPADSVRGGLHAVERAADSTGKEEARRTGAAERAEAARKSSDGVAVLRQMSAA